MGCGSSKDEVEPQPIAISQPQGGIQMIPQAERDEQGIPMQHLSFDIDKTHLERALLYAAEYLQQNNVHFNLVTVGGAINILLLKSRQTTHDVDFFLPENRPPNLRLLEQAARVAEAKASLPLGRDWLNNAMTLTIPLAVRQILNQEAMQQNEIVFQRPGLTIFAAPWLFALCTKIRRLADPRKRKPYDALDGASYLYRYNMRQGGHPVAVNTLREAARRYQVDFVEEACREVEVEYRSRYRCSGISF